ncbi:MAG TPA: DNA polymerase IV [Candidatus Tectomicrobia bacterium]|nr:DNA polymerase IV [Candidatus Tectomicrobia bacterium]
MTGTRRVVHIDMDAFYAAVEQLDHPEFRGRPVIVGADPREGKGRGVVSTASYEARPFGVHSAMPISQAYRLCPDAIFLPVRMARYHEISERIFAIFQRYTDVVEPLSIDEAFLDVSGSTRLFGSVEDIAQGIKQDILREERLVASVGVAPNKFLAKLASELSKPDGFLVLHEADVEAFLRHLPVSRLWGVGKQTAPQLEALGLRTIGQVAQWPRARLARRFGSLGTHIWELAHGVDDRPVTPHRDPKSIGAETTFAEDTDDVEVLRRTLLELAEKVGQRLRGEGFMATKVTLKYRDAEFVTLTRTQSLAEPTAVALGLYQAAFKLLNQVAAPTRKVRLLGVAASELTSQAQQQLSLFADTAHKRLRAERAEDVIKARFGPQAITRAALLDPANTSSPINEERHL